MPNYIILSNGDFVSEDELYHYGVKGMKWGVRRYQNADGTLTAAGKKRQDRAISRINTMYDRTGKWTTRKIQKLTGKGKINKANVMKELDRQNESARKIKTSNVQKMNAEQYNKSRRLDTKDALFGGQNWMKNNSANMTTFISRLNEYQIQRGMRWASNFTLESTLGRMTPREGVDYLKTKQSYYNGVYSSHTYNR